MNQATYFRVTPGRPPAAGQQEQTNTVIEQIMGPYDVAQLKTAFQRVANKDDWKEPVDCDLLVADESDRDLLRRAVMMWAGSEPTFTHLGGQLYRVTAPGYREVIGT